MSAAHCCRRRQRHFANEQHKNSWHDLAKKKYIRDEKRVSKRICWVDLNSTAAWSVGIKSYSLVVLNVHVDDDKKI